MLAFTVAGQHTDEEDLHVILNMSDQSLDMPLPVMHERRWHLALDTTQSTPADILVRDRQMPVIGGTYLTGPRSVVVLEARE